MAELLSGPRPIDEVTDDGWSSGSAPGLAKTARLSALWSLGSKGGLRLVNFATSVVLARLLTPVDFGIVAAARGGHCHRAGRGDGRALRAECSRLPVGTRSGGIFHGQIGIGCLYGRDQSPQWPAAKIFDRDPAGIAGPGRSLFIAHLKHALR